MKTVILFALFVVICGSAPQQYYYLEDDKTVFVSLKEIPFRCEYLSVDASTFHRHPLNVSDMAYEKGKLQLFVLPQEQFQIIMTNSSGEAEAGFIFSFGLVTKVELNGETIKSLYTPHTIVPSEPNEIYIDFTRDASITIIINKVTTIGMPYPDDERLGNFETLFFGGNGMEKQSTLFYNCNYLRY